MDSAYIAIVYFAILSLLQVTSGLKCRVDNDDRTQEGFHDVVRACMNPNNLRDQELHRPNRYNNNNNNHNNNWQQRTQWGLGIPRFPTKDDRDRNGNRKQEDNDDHETSRDTNYNSGINYNRGSHNNNNNSNSRGRRTNHTFPATTSSRRRNHSNNDNDGSPLEDIDPCVVHCIFQQMNMLDNNSQPDKNAVINAMTGRLRDPELREFITDAISECFDLLESDSYDTKCSLSKSFAMCLEQKGKQNCEDWDDKIQTPPYKHSGLDTSKHRG